MNNSAKCQPARAPQTLPGWTAKSAYFCSRTELLHEIEQILEAISRWNRIVIRPDRHGLTLGVANATLGHLRWDGRLAVRLPSDICDRLVAEKMAARDPDPSQPDRVVWVVRTPADVDRALWLLRLSFLLCCGDAREQIDNPPMWRDHS